MPRPHDFTPEDLLPLIGTQGAPCLVDVRTDEDFAASPRLVPGAFRHPHGDVASLATRTRGPVVVICHKGLKLSHGAAAWLRTEGIDARALRGGWLGWTALAGAPTRADTPLVTRDDGRTCWVSGPLDAAPGRIAALWLLRRFVDPAARILIVPEAEIRDVAHRFRAPAIAADTGADVFGRTLRDFDLTTPALQAMAGTLTRDDGPATLLSALARLHETDAGLLEAALPVCDALHAREAT